MAVATTCRGVLAELIGRQNFKPIVTIPRTVNMATSLGLVDSILLHKTIVDAVREVSIRYIHSSKIAAKLTLVSDFNRIKLLEQSSAETQLPAMVPLFVTVYLYL
jgi:hypothetical protein